MTKLPICALPLLPRASLVSCGGPNSQTGAVHRSARRRGGRRHHWPSERPRAGRSGHRWRAGRHRWCGGGGCSGPAECAILPRSRRPVLDELLSQATATATTGPPAASTNVRAAISRGPSARRLRPPARPWHRARTRTRSPRRPSHDDFHRPAGQIGQQHPASALAGENGQRGHREPGRSRRSAPVRTASANPSKTASHRGARDAHRAVVLVIGHCGGQGRTAAPRPDCRRPRRGKERRLPRIRNPLRRSATGPTSSGCGLNERTVASKAGWASMFSIIDS